MDEKKMNELQAIIHESVLEIMDLKAQVLELEARINRLENKETFQEEESLPLPADDLGEKAILNLYNTGYHVCPASYGQKRDGECLFCLQFLSEQ